LKEVYGEKYPEIRKQTLRKCEGCLLGKSHRSSVRKTTDEKTKPTKELDVLVSDLKMMPTRGRNGAVYVGNAIDKKTKYTVLGFLYSEER
jgi:hypothetical protein